MCVCARVGRCGVHSLSENSLKTCYLHLYKYLCTNRKKDEVGSSPTHKERGKNTTNPQDGSERESNVIQEHSEHQKGTSLEYEVDPSSRTGPDLACVFVVFSKFEQEILEKTSHTKSEGRKQPHAEERGWENNTAQEGRGRNAAPPKRRRGGKVAPPTNREEERRQHPSNLLWAPLPPCGWCCFPASFVEVCSSHFSFSWAVVVFPLPFRAVPLFPVILSTSPFEWRCGALSPSWSVLRWVWWCCSSSPYIVDTHP